jgi:glycerol-3-phosphate dehydrogenase (NAD(P)+)
MTNSMRQPAAAVLGDGTMATALAHVIASQGRPCTLWSTEEAVESAINGSHRHPRFFPGVTLAQGLVATTNLEVALRDASLVIASVPSGSFEELARALGQFPTEGKLLLASTKGLAPGSNKRMSELLADYSPRADVGAIGGANITPDIMTGQLTAIIVATPSKAGLELAESVLATPRMRVFGSEDLLSIELVSALKNVAAIATGIAIGLNLGFNTAGFVLTEALREVRALTKALGASTEAFHEGCGIGDLYLTCSHPGSLNRRVGVELGTGRKLAEILTMTQEVPEGINTLRAHLELAREHGVSTPIAEGVQAIMNDELPPTALLDLMPKSGRI